MRFVSLLLTLGFLVSCDRTEKAAPPAGLKSTDLPTALHSRGIEADKSHYIEIVITTGNTEIFHLGKPVTTATTPDELFTALKKLREENEMLGYSTPLLISAPGSMQFGFILGNIQTAMNSGIYQILFLVSSESSNEPRVVSRKLPSLPGPSVIDPYFLHITPEGEIYSGIGDTRTRIDEGIQDQNLYELSDHLQLYRSAASAAGISDAPCQILVDPKASYQRVIDLLSLTNKHDIKALFTDSMPEP